MNIVGPRSNVWPVTRRSSCIEKNIKINWVLPLGGREITIQIKKFAKCQRLWVSINHRAKSHVTSSSVSNPKQVIEIDRKIIPSMNSTPRSTKHKLWRIQGLFIFYFFNSYLVQTGCHMLQILALQETKTKNKQ